MTSFFFEVYDWETDEKRYRRDGPIIDILRGEPLSNCSFSFAEIKNAYSA